MDYKARVLNEIETKPGCWKYLNIGVFEIADDGTEKQVGNYERKYSTMYDTFFAFQQKGKWYALYSSDYKATSVMSLPDCKHIATEPENTWGFCPTGFYVPSKEDLTHHSIYHLYEAKGELDKAEAWFAEHPDNRKDGLEFEQWLKDNVGCFGFVCGCGWGDDQSWKLEYLDLNKITDGVITRRQRYGYLELPNHLKLKECLNWDAFWAEDHRVEIATKKNCYVGEIDEWELKEGAIYQFREDTIYNGIRVKIKKSTGDAAIVEVLNPKSALKKEDVWIESYQFERYAKEVVEPITVEA